MDSCSQTPTAIKVANNGFEFQPWTNSIWSESAEMMELVQQQNSSATQPTPTQQQQLRLQDSNNNLNQQQQQTRSPNYRLIILRQPEASVRAR